MAPLTTVTSSGILDGTIVNADVNASAAIALSKLASHPSVLTGSTSNTIPIVTGANALSGQANLQFNGSGDLTVIGNEGVSANLYLRADEGDDNGDGWRIGSNQDTNDLTFANNTSGSYVDKLTLLKTGEVGINTSTPAAFLEISAGSSGTDVNVLRLDSAGGGAFNIQCSDASSGTPLWKFDLGISEALQIDSATTTRFISGSGDSSIAIGKTGAANDAVVIKYDESGDKLHFYGWGGSEGDILTLDNGNSRVGIGTNSPGRTLHLESADPRIRLTDSGGGGNVELQNAGGNSILKTDGSHHLQFFTDNTERVRITNSGDVGIGVTSPNCALQITDTTSHTAYAQAAPSATACMLQLFNNPSSEATNNHASLQFGVNGGTQNRVGSISAVAEDSGNRKLALAFCTDSGGNRNERIRIRGDGGITFNGDTAAANALDDYEEGTWTPTLVVTGNSSANVTLNDGGTYTKVGRHVYARAYITLTSKGSGASASAPVFLGGLPFTATSGHSAGAVHYWHNTPTDYVYVTGTVQSNTVNFLIRMATAAHDQASNMRFDGIQDGSSFIYSVSYEV